MIYVPMVGLVQNPSHAFLPPCALVTDEASFYVFHIYLSIGCAAQRSLLTREEKYKGSLSSCNASELSEAPISARKTKGGGQSDTVLASDLLLAFGGCREVLPPLGSEGPALFYLAAGDEGNPKVRGSSYSINPAILSTS